MSTKRWCVQLSDGRWIKRTANFGHSHGKIYVTKDPDDRRWWSREADAKSKASAVNGRIIRRSKWGIKGIIENEFAASGITAEAKDS